jgi:hypothetical protein
VGQDREDRPGHGKDVIRRRQSAPSRSPFSQEVQAALRYERGLALKTVLALAVVAALVLAHVYLFT